MNEPNLYPLGDLKGCFDGNWELTNINDSWVPARPLGAGGLVNRLRLAWLVFTGKVDALLWPQDNSKCNKIHPID